VEKKALLDHVDHLVKKEEWDGKAIAVQMAKLA